MLLGVFTLNGIYPGPLLLVKEPALISTLYWSMLLINLVSFALLALLLRPFAMIVKVPPAILSVSVIVVSMIGIYAVNTRLFDCGVALASGCAGICAAADALAGGVAGHGHRHGADHREPAARDR